MGRIRRLYLARVEEGRAWTLPLLQVAASHGVELVWLERGQSLRVGDWTFRCLWPPGPSRDDPTNDRSLVLRGGPTGREILLTGDLESGAESALLALGDTLDVAVLKVAHHGSKTGTSAQLLGRMGEGWALVSCGVGNRYGHPHGVTLEALREHGWRVLRTDEQGAVGAVWRRQGVNARSVRPPP
jgi:competence protein ComEC